MQGWTWEFILEFKEEAPNIQNNLNTPKAFQVFEFCYAGSFFHLLHDEGFDVSMKQSPREFKEDSPQKQKPSSVSINKAKPDRYLITFAKLKTMTNSI